jgi:hypothetical protein
MLIISCNSNKSITRNSKKNDRDKSLYTLNKDSTVEKNGQLITSFKKSKLLQIIDKKGGSMKYKFQDKDILSVQKECLVLVELFEKKFVLISYDLSRVNINVAGPELFIREKILVIDNSNGKVLKLEFKVPSYLKINRSSLSHHSKEKNVYAIRSIDFKNQKIILDSNKRQKIIKLGNVVI